MLVWSFRLTEMPLALNGSVGMIRNVRLLCTHTDKKNKKEKSVCHVPRLCGGSSKYMALPITNEFAVLPLICRVTLGFCPKSSPRNFPFRCYWAQ